MATMTPAQSVMTTLTKPANLSSSHQPTNPVMECLLSHSSDRNYLPTPVDDAIITQILKAGHRAPTSCNSQQTSVIVIRDPQKIARIGKLSQDQSFVARCPVFLVICGDLRKANMAIEKYASKPEAMTETLEGFAQICVDAGIALQAMMLAARSFDLGVVPIGAIRENLLEVSKLLELPPRVVPVLGMCMGYVEKHSPLKPRMDFTSFAHMEKYNADDEALSKTIVDYDETLMNHWKLVAREDGGSYSQRMSKDFSKPWFPNLRSELKQQHYVV